MTYDVHFELADKMIEHLSGVVKDVQDAFIVSRYTGFVAVSAVTVYELAIKDIFCSFAAKENKLLGSFVERYFHKINGRVSLKNIKEDYIIRFGEVYVDQFNTNLSRADDSIVRVKKRSITTGYDNIVRWRHGFVHEGKPPTTATFDEIITAYDDGKEVIRCIYESMQ